MTIKVIKMEIAVTFEEAVEKFTKKLFETIDISKSSIYVNYEDFSLDEFFETWEEELKEEGIENVSEIIESQESFSTFLVKANNLEKICLLLAVEPSGRRIVLTRWHPAEPDSEETEKCDINYSIFTITTKKEY